jgi:vitamin B12 transporter
MSRSSPPRVVRPVLAALLSLGSWALAADRGALNGVIRTIGGSPVPQIALRVEGPGCDRAVVSGPDGRFRLAGLVAGSYSLKLEAPGFVLSPTATAQVQTDQATTVELTLLPAPVREYVVVSATRNEATTSSLGTTVAVLDATRIAERESSSFLNLVQEVPGVSVARSGGVGAQGTIFLRGGASNFARVLVDGVPVNEPGGAWNFGPQLPFELERVEVVKGAASSLYSTDALAGVIHLATRRPALGERASWRGEAEGGSFSWQRYGVGSSGRRGGLDWNAGMQYLDTDNEQPNAGFRETSGALSAGAAIGPQSSLRLLLRADDSRLGTPGPTAYGRPDLDASFDVTAVVAGLSFRHAGPRVAHEARAGWTRSDQLSRNPLDSGSFLPQAGDLVAAFPYSDFADPLGFQNDTRRLSVGYQADVRVDGRHLLSAGIDVEHESGQLGARSDGLFLSPTRTNVGAYVQDRLDVGRLFATIGARIERNDSFGTKVVPRVALGYRARGGADATTLRASAGTGIKEPDFFQSFGTASYALGNPDLEPERSRTFDVGVEQRAFRGRVRADVTFFHHDYRDEIAYQYDFASGRGTYVNLGRTRGRGVEVALSASPRPRLSVSAEYTYLDGEVLVSTNGFDPVYAEGQPLVRQPKHQGSLSARFGSERFSVGASLVGVGRRADSDFVGIGLTSNDPYARVDARAHGQLLRGLSAYVVAENILDRKYQEVLGYPALGRAVRVGLRFRSPEAGQP